MPIVGWPSKVLWLKIGKLREIQGQSKELYYRIESVGERILAMCRDDNTEHLMAFIERNEEFLQFLRKEIEESFIWLLLNANYYMAVMFIKMGLNLSDPYFKMCALRLVEGSVLNKGMKDPTLLRILLEAGCDPSCPDNESYK